MKYIIGFLVSIGLLILVFVLIFRGGGDDTPQNQPAQLVTYATTDTTVRLIQDYPVTANQTHHELVTTVGRDQVTFTVENGYEGQVLRSQNYANNETAYANFLRALQVAGYNNGTSDADKRDERGYCPTGYRYIYEIINGSGNVTQRYWSTSCGNIGNFKGKTDTIRSLYRSQVPDYNKLTSNLNQ